MHAAAETVEREPLELMVLSSQCRTMPRAEDILLWSELLQVGPVMGRQCMTGSYASCVRSNFAIQGPDENLAVLSVERHG